MPNRIKRTKLYLETEAYKLGVLGVEFWQLAEFWDTRLDVLERYCKRNPNVLKEYERGKREANLAVVQALLNKAREGDVKAAMFWLKNRCGWKDLNEKDKEEEFLKLFKEV